MIEISFKNRKTQLEQCLALALLATDLRNLEDTLDARITALSASSDQLGDSSASAELLFYELKKLQAEAKVTSYYCFSSHKTLRIFPKCGQAISIQDELFAQNSFVYHI